MDYKLRRSDLPDMGPTEHKSVPVVEFKADDSGRFEAVVLTYDTRDLDGDVVMSGAIPEGAPVAVSPYGHASMGQAPPVGRATIGTRGNEGVASGKFFLNTTAGREAFTVVKEMGDAQEWSWGYDPLDFEHSDWNGQRARFLRQVKVYEVSPVLRGASIGTRTLVAKTTGPVDLHAIKAQVDARRLGDDYARTQTRLERARFEETLR